MQIGEMNDITAPAHVQVQIRADGKVVWVNVNGVCVLRCCQIGNLEIEDNRPVCPHCGKPQAVCDAEKAEIYEYNNDEKS